MIKEFYVIRRRYPDMTDKYLCYREDANEACLDEHNDFEADFVFKFYDKDSARACLKVFLSSDAIATAKLNYGPKWETILRVQDDGLRGGWK